MNEKMERIMAVQRMQEYIMVHYQEEITLEQLAVAAFYSPWHALRAFSELTGKTPFEYLRLVRLTEAAKKLRDTDQGVLDIALDVAFSSHEGFTKAFSRQFAIAPRRYRKTAPPIPFFSYYPVSHYYLELERRKNTMKSSVVFTQVIERPARKLILKRGIKAADYFTYCEEVGCDVWGILESVKNALYEPIGLWLPESMRKDGTSEYCQGVEMPVDSDAALPESFDLIDLSELLSGNIFCGHCGARLTVTTNGKKYYRKDGKMTVTPRTRYVCYNRTRHPHLCDGQTGYTVRKLDAIINNVVHQLFEQLEDVPRDAVIAEQYSSQIAQLQLQLTQAKATLQACNAEVAEYEAEVIKVIRGESRLSEALLNKLYEESKKRANQAAQMVEDLEVKIQDSAQMKRSLSQQYETLRTWADMYDQCDIATKKMILSRIMTNVKVKRNYEVYIASEKGARKIIEKWST